MRSRLSAKQQSSENKTEAHHSLLQSLRQAVATKNFTELKRIADFLNQQPWFCYANAAFISQRKSTRYQAIASKLPLIEQIGKCLNFTLFKAAIDTNNAERLSTLLDLTRNSFTIEDTLINKALLYCYMSDNPEALMIFCKRYRYLDPSLFSPHAPNYRNAKNKHDRYQVTKAVGTASIFPFLKFNYSCLNTRHIFSNDAVKCARHFIDTNSQESYYRAIRYNATKIFSFLLANLKTNQPKHFLEELINCALRNAGKDIVGLLLEDPKLNVPINSDRLKMICKRADPEILQLCLSKNRSFILDDYIRSDLYKLSKSETVFFWQYGNELLHPLRQTNRQQRSRAAALLKYFCFECACLSQADKTAACYEYAQYLWLTKKPILMVLSAIANMPPSGIQQHRQWILKILNKYLYGDYLLKHPEIQATDGLAILLQTDIDWHERQLRLSTLRHQHLVTYCDGLSKELKTTKQLMHELATFVKFRMPAQDPDLSSEDSGPLSLEEDDTPPVTGKLLRL